VQPFGVERGARADRQLAARVVKILLVDAEVV